MDKEVWNIPIVYRVFIRRHGCISTKRTPIIDDNTGEIIIGTDTTVEEFSNICNTGTYLLEVGPKGSSRSNHLVCVIDGDYYDSWDCSNNIVYNVYTVSADSSPSPSLPGISDIKDELIEFVRSCLDKYNIKMPWATFQLLKPYQPDDYTYQQVVRCKLDAVQLEEVGYGDFYAPTYKYTVKLNPRQDLETNLSKIKEKLRVRLREWAYSVRVDIEADLAACRLETRPDFYGDTRLLLKLPEWCRPLVSSVEDEGERASQYSDRYILYMSPLPDDPYHDQSEELRFIARTLTELRNELKLYYENYDVDLV